MRAVKSRDTTPELIVRALLRRFAPSYRLHRKDLPGNPDIAYIGKRRAIFVHGCFWHGHDCPRGARAPKANAEKLSELGWSALTVWECELKDLGELERRLRAFLA